MRVGPAAMADLDDLLARPLARVFDSVQVSPIQTHWLLAVEVFPGCDHVKITVGVQVARDGAALIASRPSLARKLFPGAVGGARRAFPDRRFRRR